MAHPDDESFGISGTIARYVQEGVAVFHVCATRGEAGSSRPQHLSRQEFGALREQELRRAGRILGFKKIFLLGYPDGGLEGVSVEEAVNRLLTIVQEVQPQVMITFSHRGVTGHPDHQAVHHWATHAFHQGKGVHRLYYSTLPPNVLASRGLPVEKGKVKAIIDVSRYLSFKRRAIHAHRSQWPGVQRIFSFAGGAHPLSKKDYFLLGAAAPLAYHDEVETDLFSHLL